MPIICGSDLSAASAGALDVAVALARLRDDDRVVLVHIIDPELDSPASHDQALADARASLADLAASRSTSDGPTIATELMVGPPDVTLCSVAETEGSDLIVIAARSTSSSLLRLGTTTSKVIARATMPVLVVRDPAPWLQFARGERPLRVLLGIDDSVACDISIQWTQALRARGPVEVVLGAIYYVDDATAHYGLDHHPIVERDPDVERLMTRDLLRRFGAGEGVVARPRRGLGRIGDHVIELANEEHVDAIIVGTGQKTGLGRLGSVSSVVVNDATQSVVTVPPQAGIANQRVPTFAAALAATDLSPLGNRAVPYAFALASERGCEVHILHVVKDDDEYDEADVKRQLMALVPRGATQRVEAHIVVADDAATAVAQTAARLGVDVICIASHGRSGITRALVGSVADKLLRATRLPVLVLRPS